MNDRRALEYLIHYRKSLWDAHRDYMLENILLRMEKSESRSTKTDRCVVVIDNRLERNWLFTVLNATLMSQTSYRVIAITDGNINAISQNVVVQEALKHKVELVCVQDIISGASLADVDSYNRLMKNALFWRSFDCEKLLIYQTDAIQIEPIPELYWEQPYIGAPFIPRQQSEYFESWNREGERCGFFKVDTEIHNKPNKGVYPHLNGNGGFSIRNRDLMQLVCTEHGNMSTSDEMEDVFFSRYISSYVRPAPLPLAMSFACEAKHQSSALGCHAGWKYLSSSEMTQLFERHWKTAWSLLQL